MEPGSPLETGISVLHLAAVGGATALAFAGILAFAAIVTGLATALALAGILAFTGVFVRISQLMNGRADGGAACVDCMSTHCRTCEQASHRRAYDHCL